MLKIKVVMSKVVFNDLLKNLPLVHVSRSHYGSSILLSMMRGTLATPTIWPRFGQKYCDTSGRLIAIQMGGVLQYKWEDY